MSVTAPEIVEKQPSEKRLFTMDFSALMATAETIDSVPVVVSETDCGGTSDLTITGVSVDGQIVSMWIEGGTDLTMYRIQVNVDTSTGQTLAGDGKLKVSGR